MAKFKIVTTAGPGTGVPGADHSLEMEALAGIGAEIVEVKASHVSLISKPNAVARLIVAAAEATT